MRPSIRKYLRTCYMHLCYLTRPRNVKSAYFASFRGQYSDNPRAISETLHRLAPSVKIVWAVTEKFTPFLPPYVTAVPPASFRALCAQARANVWVLNYTERRGLGIYKGRENFYIQTWHGDRGLKTIGYLTADKKEILDGPDLKQCDLFVAASDYGVRKARQGLHYQGEVIVEGMPRNDKLLNADLHREEISRVRDTLGISPDSKVLLYAPTFREGERQSQQCAIDIPQTLKNLESNGGEWVCLLRSHSRSKGITTRHTSLITDRCKDVTSYPDMADLLLIADLLITDYSSCAGDFLLTGRPLILAHYDREIYETRQRTLWVDPQEAGYLVAKNQDELNDIARRLPSYDHKAIADRVNRFYGTHETGQSSVAVAKRILKELKISL